jgi:hypothetical protein
MNKPDGLKCEMCDSARPPPEVAKGIKDVSDALQLFGLSSIYYDINGYGCWLLLLFLLMM